MSEIQTEPRAPHHRGVAATPDCRLRRVWRVPKRPAIVVALILLAVWLVPQLRSFAPPETVSLMIVNETKTPRIAAVIDAEDPLSPRSERESLLIPANSRVEVDELPRGGRVMVLVFDETCHLLTPWPFGTSPNIGPGQATFISDNGIAYWGDASAAADVPVGLATSKGCR